MKSSRSLNFHQMQSRTALLFATSSLTAISLAMAPAAAQVDTIVVTAEKRAESIQDVAISLEAFGGDELSDANINKPRDLFRRVPNVSLQTNSTAGQLQLSIRGISFPTFSPFGVQPVLVFQDEVVLNSPAVGGVFIHDPGTCRSSARSAKHIIRP